MYDHTTLYNVPATTKVDQLNWLWPLPPSMDTLVLADATQWYEAEATTARKLLQAIGLGEDNAAVAVITPDQSVAIAELRQALHMKRVIVLGLSRRQLRLQANVKYHQPVVMEALTVIFGHSLHKMNNEPTHKAALWKPLQHMYTTK